MRRLGGDFFQIIDPSIMYQKKLRLPIEDYYLEGTLSLPVRAKSLIIFAHGHGKDRFIKINNHIARHLQQAGFGTLLFDLISPEQDNYEEAINDFKLLGKRLITIALWLSSHSEYSDLKQAFFASGRGVSIALQAAAKLDSLIETLVCAGGHPEQVKADLPSITKPAFFIFGEMDRISSKLDQAMLKSMPGTKRMVVIPGSSSLFEEPGKLDVLAKYTVSWFSKYLPAGQPEVSLSGEILDEDATITK